MSTQEDSAVPTPPEAAALDTMPVRHAIGFVLGYWATPGSIDETVREHAMHSREELAAQATRLVEVLGAFGLGSTLHDLMAVVVALAMREERHEKKAR